MTNPIILTAETIEQIICIIGNDATKFHNDENGQSAIIVSPADKPNIKSTFFCDVGWALVQTPGGGLYFELKRANHNELHCIKRPALKPQTQHITAELEAV
ncbi:MAG: hypothetical protein HRU28_08525 [Rhizobiales bacterium]|nr:hypothetical protein [Hyphomicrobiales bacterium]